MQIPVITGPGDFDVQVVGQRRRQDEFINVCGPFQSSGYNSIVRAHLDLAEHSELDSRTVSVRVNGSLLGYLPIDVALDFRRAIIDGDLSEYTRFECAAAICGGRLHTNGSTEEFRISLDLPQDDPKTANCSAICPSSSERNNPHIGAFRSEALVDRQIDELIGIVKGVTSDGIVTQAEVEYLLCWMDANRKAANLWPAKVLYPRLIDAIHGGAMSIEKESEVLDLLMRTVGGNTATREGHQSDSSQLPYTSMDVPIYFPGFNFCFTGVFASGSRNWCHEKVVARGGQSTGSITKKLHYLVVGGVGNENWLHSTHGRKIEKAVKYNDDGCKIAIISEEFWHSHL